MNATPAQVNGTTRPAVPLFEGWQPFPIIKGTMQNEPPTPEPAPVAVPVVDPRAEAEAAAIRARTAADVEAARLKAEAEADAIRVQAEAKAEQQRIANERAEMRLEKEREEHDAKVAEIRKRREAAEREAEAAREQDSVAQEAEKAEQAKRGKSATSWKRAALTFAVACGVVALPVQMSAFYNPHAKWLLAAPLMLEGGAWVVLRGAAAAVDDHRPHWHYRLIAWLLAFIAAAVNLSHGLAHFDPATAIGTAFASLAGPGIWDLHEHGRIRVRDGVLTRRERKAKERAEKRAAAEKAAAEARQRAEKEAAETAAAEVVAKLAEDRAEKFPKVWEHALKLAAGLGETTVTEAVWKRAYNDVEGTDPGDSAEAQQLRNSAARRMLDARADAPDPSVWKIANPQAASQVPPSVNKRQYSPPVTPGVRRKGDAPKFVTAARKQASIAAKQSATNPPKES